MKKFYLISRITSQIEKVGFGDENPFRSSEMYRTEEHQLSVQEAVDYIRSLRAKSYPGVNEFLDAYYHERKGRPDMMKRWLTRVTEVKEQFAVPSEWTPTVAQTKSLGLNEPKGRLNEWASHIKKWLVYCLRKGNPRRWLTIFSRTFK